MKLIFLLFLLIVDASSPTQYTGRINVMAIDNDIGESEVEYYIKLTSGETYVLSIDDTPIKGIVTGYGHLSTTTNVLTLYNYTYLSESVAKDVTSFPDSRSVAIFYMNLQGRLCGFNSGSGSECQWCETFEEVKQFFYGNPNSNVVSFFKEVSDNKLELLINETSVFDVVTSQSINGLYSEFDNVILSEIGVNVADYDHVMFFLPWNWYRVSPFTRYSVRGIGETPGKRTWVKGCNAGTGPHELGHNLGFGHTNAWYESGSRREYSDYSSVMGSPRGYRVGINSVHRLVAGWLPESSVVVTNGTGVWSLSRLNDIVSKHRVVVFEPNNENITDSGPFYIEYRERIGYDNELNSPPPKTNPKGLYYDSLLVRKLEIINGYRKDTILIGIIGVGEKMTFEGVFDLLHSSPGTVSITKHSDDRPASGAYHPPKMIWIVVIAIIALTL